MSALCKNCRHEASRHTTKVVYDGPPEFLKCKRCVACYPTTVSAPPTPSNEEIRAAYERLRAWADAGVVKHEDYYQLRQPFILTARIVDAAIEELLQLRDMQATMQLPETMKIEKQCGYCGYRSTWANWVWVDGGGQCPKCGKPDWSA